MKIHSHLFFICTSFLELLGKVTGLSYGQISVVFNIYIQGTLLMISGIFPLIATLIDMTLGFSWNCLLYVLISAAYFSIYIVLYILLLYHYRRPLDVAFDKCVNDLMRLSKHNFNAYYIWNLIIFVFWWLTLIAFNLLVSYIIAVH